MCVSNYIYYLSSSICFRLEKLIDVLILDCEYVIECNLLLYVIESLYKKSERLHISLSVSLLISQPAYRCSGETLPRGDKARCGSARAERAVLHIIIDTLQALLHAV